MRGGPRTLEHDVFRELSVLRVSKSCSISLFNNEFFSLDESIESKNALRGRRR